MNILNIHVAEIINLLVVILKKEMLVHLLLKVNMEEVQFMPVQGQDLTLYRLPVKEEVLEIKLLTLSLLLQ